MLETIWMYLKVFVVGGILCMIGQFLMLKTKMNAARILVGYVTLGVILGAVGLYPPLVTFAGAGATIPLLGFGNSLAKGVLEAVAEKGLLGAFTGGLTATAAGVAAAVFFGYLFAIVCTPKMKV
ncbi:MAG: SpoVA/SpoVAEb family sporulation membrane protein [Firmicutes bacterium]|nr:SpoVA/SpoVAEb family sporulation membrane protein [Bacillota bacterium]